MRASIRRSCQTPTSRSRRTLAAVAALSLGLAACGDDEGAGGTDEAEVEAPADDAVEEDGGTGEGAEQPEAALEFEDLEENEIVPGVYLEVPEEQTGQVQAQKTPVGSAYLAALNDQSGAVSVNVQFEGPDVEGQLEAIDAIVESGQAEIAEGPEEIDIEGADEASRVVLTAPEGEATATGLFIVADGNAISLAIEVTEDADVDVDTIVDSLRIDPERLQMAGTAEPPAITDGGATDGATDGTAGADAGTTEEPDTEG